VHKRRNLKAHVPERHWPKLERWLSEAYYETDYAKARASLEGTARWLDRLNADAAASLREGLEETLTVVRSGVPRGVAPDPGDDQSHRVGTLGVAPGYGARNQSA
jgi:hypothetical protein